MKVPLKHRAMSSVLHEQNTGYYPSEIKLFDYAHNEVLLGEIAGHVFNRYLKFRKEKNGLGERYEFRFGSDNPNKAILHLHQFIDKVEERQSAGRIREVVYENACEELLFKAFEAIDAIHKLDNNFFERIKYVFKRP